MPLHAENRLFIHHEKQLFNPKILTELLEFLANFKIDQSQLSEREKKVASQGGTSDQVRLNMVWYKPWKADLERLCHVFDPYTYVIFPAQIRELKSDSNPVPWHQDSGYQKSAGISITFPSYWVKEW